MVDAFIYLKGEGHSAVLSVTGQWGQQVGFPPISTLDKAIIIIIIILLTSNLTSIDIHTTDYKVKTQVKYFTKFKSPLSPLSS